MDKFLTKPNDDIKVDVSGKYEKFNLKENPFPTTPVINKDSKDIRVNGSIYESAIRRKEYEQIKNNFLMIAQSDPSHIRLGYMIDTSYVGRGNGKSSFLINLMKTVNAEYCFDLSNKTNKCFAVYVSPEPGGRTKTFISFIDKIVFSIGSQNLIDICLSILRLKAIIEIYNKKEISQSFRDENEMLSAMCDKDWYSKNGFDLIKINNKIQQNPIIKDLPSDFPIKANFNALFPVLVTQKEILEYYLSLKNDEKLDYLFNDLVSLFQASDFNGSYILVDDFERIPDFQSARQKRDFAFELRSCIFDGSYKNARIGFYNFILVLHAGVQRLIADAWSDSGMENRAPIAPQVASSHVIPFEKLERDQLKLLLIKHLDAFRNKPQSVNKIFPFTDGSINKVSELAELNAAKFLKMHYQLIEIAIQKDIKEINESFIAAEGKAFSIEESPDKTISNISDTDLFGKAKG